MTPSGGGEGEYALYVPGHGHEAPLAARLVEPAHRNVNWRVRQSLMQAFQAMITISIGLGVASASRREWTCSRASSAQWTRGKSHLLVGPRSGLDKAKLRPG